MKTSMNAQKLFVSIFSLLITAGSLFSADPHPLPENHRDLTRPANYEQIKQLLQSASEKEFIEMETIGRSVEGRDLFLVKLDHRSSNDPWRVFFYAQQHGNEPAGKDALLYLVKYISENPDLLPDDVSLWIIPQVNPDGAAADKRRNANGADLNRDHQTLFQPETRALYQTFRRFMPHVAVDCHEFARDSQGYTKNGWLEWPIIMMGTANNPLYSKEVVQAGIRWCEEAVPYMRERGHNFARYFVGGTPPDDELRYSSPEVDDGRNGLGAYGGLSFIIESGVQRYLPDTNADLHQRVDAYIELFSRFIRDDRYREEDKKRIAVSRAGVIPGFIPTNYFWGNVGSAVTDVKVIDRMSGRDQVVRTANFMHDLVIKKSVTTPYAYAIDAQYSKKFIPLLEAHQIPFQTLSKKESFRSEGALLVKFDEEEDEIYNRYGGRQIVKADTSAQKAFDTGSIIVSLNPEYAIRAILLLEPNQMYGIYNAIEFRDLKDKSGRLPVWRILR